MTKGQSFYKDKGVFKKVSITVLAVVVIALLIIMLLISREIGREDSKRITDNGDLNQNGIVEEYILEKQELTVYEDNKLIWKSPKEYNIDSFALADVNNDGNINLVISLWKYGSFGNAKPFWQQAEQDQEYKNHLFIYSLSEKGFKQVWCSSNLVRPIVEFSITDINGDGLNELVVEEGKYKYKYKNIYTLDTKAPTSTNVFEWSEWGFLKKEKERIY